jgi:hypothetical protein
MSKITTVLVPRGEDRPLKRKPWFMAFQVYLPRQAFGLHGGLGSSVSRLVSFTVQDISSFTDGYI